MDHTLRDYRTTPTPNPFPRKGRLLCFLAFLMETSQMWSLLSSPFLLGECDNIFARRAFRADPKRAMHILISYYLSWYKKKTNL